VYVTWWPMHMTRREVSGQHFATSWHNHCAYEHANAIIKTLDTLRDRFLPCSLLPQVLEVLSGDPSNPEIPTALRVAASSITYETQAALPLWLEGSLVKDLLNILKDLPPRNLGTHEAAETCAAAAAVLANIIYVARACMPGTTIWTSIVAQVSCPDVLEAVVQLGMVGPAALEPLPPEREVHVEPSLHSYRGVALQVQASRTAAQFWTPLRVCSYLLAQVLLDPATTATLVSSTPTQLQGTLAPILDTGVFRHLLLTAFGDSGCKYSFARAGSSCHKVPGVAHCLQVEVHDINYD
jgi:hypothetical protein